MSNNVNPTPSDIYHARLSERHLESNPTQLFALTFFDRLFKEYNAHSKRKWLSCLKSHPKYLGIYLWGSVGIGKTFLMDCFFESLLTTRKRRIHFHQFMQEVHAQLQRYSGHPDPLRLIAKSIHQFFDVLCLDEFFVSDIVDAMLLSGLLEALFKEGIYFVTTSNIPPEQLYKDGLRRDNFLPAISLLQARLEIIHLNLNIDYRLQYLAMTGAYYFPLNSYTTDQMHKAFDLYVNHDLSSEPYNLVGRSVPVIKQSKEAIWFDFKTLCGRMRCQQDYLSLIQTYRVIFLSNVPVLSGQPLDETLRFIQFIDILYDARIKLILSAEAIPCDLYTQGDLSFEFERTVSRLIEMQSAEYFSR